MRNSHLHSEYIGLLDLCKQAEVIIYHTKIELFKISLDTRP